MDQKRVIVIVIVAVVVVFGIVGIAWWQFYPRQDRTPVVQYVQDPKNQANPAASASPLPAGTPAPAVPAINNNQEVVIVYGNNPTYNADGSRRVQIGPASSGAPTTIVMTPMPTSSPKPAATPAKVPASAKPAETKKPVATAAAKKAPSKEYWIQVVASSSRDTVESVKRDLSAKGWNGRVSVTTVNKIDWYRLRYGPFDNSGEANKFLSWVKQSPGLATSFLVEEMQGKK